jgi:hypothetical protein
LKLLENEKEAARAIAGPATSDAFDYAFTLIPLVNIERINQIDHFIASRTTPQPLQQLSYPLVCNILGCLQYIGAVK